MARSALAGVASNWAGSGVLIVAQIASTAVTARLIAPREFGAYASAMALTGLAGYFAMSAIGTGLQRRSSLGPKVIGTAIVLSLGLAAVMALGVWLAASPWAEAWGIPTAAELIHVLAISMFLTSAATVPLALIRHRLRFGTAAVIETGTQVIGLSAGVALAFALHSALALAIGQAVAAAALVVAAAAVVRADLRPAFDRAEARELLTFSGQVSALNLGAYAVNTAPSWFAARAYGAGVLGLYSRASLIVGLPHTYLIAGVTKVLYPLYGRVRNDVVRTRILLDEGLTLTTGLTWPLFALLAGAAPVVVRVLLGSGWQGAAPLVALCALITCGGLPCNLLTSAAEAFGWMRIIARRQVVFLAGVALSMAVTYFAGLGLAWLLAGIALAQWVAYGLTLMPFLQRGLLHGRSVLVAQSIHAGTALAAYGIAVATTRAVDGVPLAVQAVCIGLVAVAFCAALVAARAWFPAGQVLGRRLSQIAPLGTGSPLLHLRTAAK